MSLGSSFLLAAVVGALLTSVARASDAQEGAHGRAQSEPSAALEMAFPSNSFSVFSNCQSLVLYSLDPSKILPLGQGFHQWRIVSTAAVEQATLRREVFERVIDGVKKGVGGVPPACFKPRHGIRASLGGKAVDLLICFDCGHLYCYVGATNGYAVFHGDKQTRSLFDSILPSSKADSPHPP
jgi:hypothetical protein